MAIASKSKPKQTIHHKKRVGQHQRQTKHYMKTYWPYLPMLAATAVVNGLISQSAALTAASTTDTSRLQIWTQSGPLLSVIVIAIAIAALAIVTVRHTLAWQRVVNKSEDFFIHHHGVDIFLVGVALVGFVVTRTV